MGTSVTAAKKRESAEREGSRSRSCAIEARLCLLCKGSTTGVEVAKAASYLRPKGTGEQ